MGNVDLVCELLDLGANMEPHAFVAGKRIQALWGKEWVSEDEHLKYYPGKIRDINEDGTYIVDYDDGGLERNVKKEWISTLLDMVSNHLFVVATFAVLALTTMISLQILCFTNVN